MLAKKFPGSRRLADSLSLAMNRDRPNDIATAVASTLCDLIHDSNVELPDCCFMSVPGHYARRELYRSEEYGFSVIAMTWGPGQGTPIHDHAGMWCVEGVWRGALEITPYELLESRDDRYRFEPRGTAIVGRGAVGSLIPPHEYHTIRNPKVDVTAVTVHVYGKPMTRCSVFEPVDNGWYERYERQLSLDGLG